MNIDYSSATSILTKSTILYTNNEIDRGIKKLAKQIESEIDGDIPLFLTVMNGGIFFAAELLKNLKTPFLCDYIHASRYGNETFGSSHITWYRQPQAKDIVNRSIYIIDDILDEGYTLAEISRFIKDIGAKSCKLVVLIDKEIDKIKPVSADYVAFRAPNQYLFGYGMDIYGLYRQLPDVYVYKE